MKLYLIPCILLLASCTAKAPVQELRIVPQPAAVILLEGTAPVAGQSIWVDEALGETARTAVADFAARLESASGKKAEWASAPEKAGIRFSFNGELADEAYTLDANAQGVTIGASALKGVLYGLATLQQMLPPAIFSGNRVKGVSWSVQAVQITDAPRFSYRGLHLDCCRHFWEMDEVKRYIDVMALYKLNNLHLHLNDDQGWRVEIKSRPLLTEVGSKRSGTCIGAEHGNSDGIPYGGFYTQAYL